MKATFFLTLLIAFGLTERDGNGTVSYLNETASGNSVKLPGGIN